MGYFDRILNHRQFRLRDIFGDTGNRVNMAICFSGLSSNKPFGSLVVMLVPSLDLIEKTQIVPLWVYTNKNDSRQDNITDWSLSQFQDHYPDNSITKLAIFHYVYAVLHDPVYRETYALNLKREFPRIPFYPDFQQWATWGEQLMTLHLGYETIEPWPLRRVEKTPSSPAPVPPAGERRIKPRLKADKIAGRIEIDDRTALEEIPPEAWEYRLGHRSALEWILEEYKEKTPRDPTIREKFNSYRFADHKETVIDLLMRVCRVSVETMQIIAAMNNAQRQIKNKD
jgi:predicted helicase